MKTSFVLPLLLFGAASHGAIALAQSPGMFSVTGDMTMPRWGHTATLLPNGKVLTVDVFHGEKVLAVHLADVINATDIRVRNLTRVTHLSMKSCESCGVILE